METIASGFGKGLFNHVSRHHVGQLVGIHVDFSLSWSTGALSSAEGQLGWRFVYESMSKTGGLGFLNERNSAIPVLVLVFQVFLWHASCIYSGGSRGVPIGGVIRGSQTQQEHGSPRRVDPWVAICIFPSNSSCSNPKMGITRGPTDWRRRNRPFSVSTQRRTCSDCTNEFGF